MDCHHFFNAFLLTLLICTCIHCFGVDNSRNPDGDCPAYCNDTIPNCFEYISFCADPKRDPIMRKKCPCTCLLCDEIAPTTSTPDPCIDEQPGVCQQYQAQCNNATLRPVICTYCKKTCNMCNDPC